MQYKLSAVRVFVTDWQRAIRFYTEIMGIPIAYRNDEIGWAQLALERFWSTIRSSPRSF